MDAWFCEFDQIFLVDLVGTGMMRAFWDDSQPRAGLKNNLKLFSNAQGIPRAIMELEF